LLQASYPFNMLYLFFFNKMLEVYFCGVLPYKLHLLKLIQGYTLQTYVDTFIQHSVCCSADIADIAWVT